LYRGPRSRWSEPHKDKVYPDFRGIHGLGAGAGPWGCTVSRTRLMYMLPPLFGLVVVAVVEAGRWYVVLAPIVLLAILPLSQRAWLPCALVLATTCSLYWPYAYPYVRMAGAGFYLSEAVLLLSLLAVMLYVAMNDTALGVFFGGLGILVLTLFLAESMGIAIGISGGVEPKAAIMSARETAFFATFWLAVIAARKGASRRNLFRVGAALAVLTVVLQVVQIVLGPHRLVFQVGSYSSLVMLDPSGGFLRVRPPGLTLVYVTAAFAASYLVWGPRRRRLVALALLLLCLVGVLLSYNRNMILGLACGLLTAGLITRRRSRLVLIAVSGVIVISAAAALLLSSSQAGVTRQVVARVLSLGNVQGLERTTLAPRAAENALALRQIEAHPLAGIGWGKSYGNYERDYGTGRLVDTMSIHNQYYGLWMRAGLLGLGTMLGLLLGGVLIGARELRSQTLQAENWMGAAIVASLVEIALSSMVGMYMSDPSSTIPLMIVLGLASAVLLERRAVHLTPAALLADTRPIRLKAPQ